MKSCRQLAICAIALTALLSSFTPLAADEPKNQPTSRNCRSTRPPSSWSGPTNSCQLILTGVLNSGRQQDLTGDASIEVADAKIVRVTSAGRVLPLANGETTITARYGDKSINVPVTTQVDRGRTCRSTSPTRSCRSSPSSAATAAAATASRAARTASPCRCLGFVPELDYQTLVKENRGRRLFPASPDNSLLLLKATGTMAHAGGKRMEVGSDEYKLIRRWIAAGTPFGSKTDPVVTKITRLSPNSAS